MERKVELVVERVEFERVIVRDDLRGASASELKMPLSANARPKGENRGFGAEDVESFLLMKLQHHCCRNKHKYCDPMVRFELKQCFCE